MGRSRRCREAIAALSVAYGPEHSYVAIAMNNLGVLLQAGMVVRRAVGTSAYYSVTDPSLGALCDIVCNRLRDQGAEHLRILSTA
mgnify:CR=1 FL=1